MCVCAKTHFEAEIKLVFFSNLFYVSSTTCSSEMFYIHLSYSSDYVFFFWFLLSKSNCFYSFVVSIFTQAKLNCEVLWDDLALEVRWAVAGETIVLQLVGKIGKKT